jgi:peroxiredoxin
MESAVSGVPHGAGNVSTGCASRASHRCHMTDRAIASRGTIFPPFELLAADGSPAGLELYRGRYNLVVVFAGEELGTGATAPLLEELAARQEELIAEMTQLLIVSHVAVASQIDPETFPLLIDADAQVHYRVDAADTAGCPTPAVSVTDRFREIYATYVSSEGSALPSAEEVIDWLRFINIQCPECGVTEWPL